MAFEENKLLLGARPDFVLAGTVHTGSRFDVVLTNPPFNLSGWNHYLHVAEHQWRYGEPPARNGNYAWLQLAVSGLAEDGRAAVAMTNHAALSENPRERAIRAAMVEDGVVGCVLAMPSQLFRSTGISVTVWLLTPPRKRKNVLFIDATAKGAMLDRVQRTLADEDINQIVAAYDDWRARGDAPGYAGIDGLSASVPLAEIKAGGYLLNPRSYVKSNASTRGA